MTKNITFLRWARRFDIAVIIWEFILFIANLVVGHLFVALVPLVFMLILGGIIALQTSIIRKAELEQRKKEALARKPDWDRIRKLERELYPGETFVHDRSYEGKGEVTSSGGLTLPTMKPKGIAKQAVERAKVPMPKCYCNFCKGRAGVHGEEAQEQYRRELEAHIRARSMHNIRLCPRCAHILRPQDEVFCRDCPRE